MTFDEEKSLETFRQHGARALEKYKLERSLFIERSLSMQRAVLDYAQIMVRSVILANGATSTAILAFLGNVGESALGPETRRLGLAAAVAALGVALGVLSTMLAYLSQWARLRVEYLSNQSEALGTQRTRTWALICVSSGLVCFLVAVAIAISAFASRS